MPADAYPSEILDHYREILAEEPVDLQFALDAFCERARDYGLAVEPSEIKYSVGFVQGDYAAFEGHVADVRAFLAYMEEDPANYNVLCMWFDGADEVPGIETRGHWYLRPTLFLSDWASCHFNVEACIDERDPDKREFLGELLDPQLDAQYDKFEKYGNAALAELAGELYKSLSDEVLYTMSDEYITEYIDMYVSTEELNDLRAELGLDTTEEAA